MGVPQSLAAVLALLALVLAVEGVTRGSAKQLFAGLLLAIVATLTFSFGDTLSTFNIQIVEQLPRWRDVPHPLPEPAPLPAPAKTEAAPAKIQTTTSNDITQLPTNQEASTKQVTASPRFYPVYPREVFMSDVDWENPAVPALVPLYDALEKGDWQGAIALNFDAIRQADTLPNKDYRYYRSHILWLWAIAKLESGDPIRAREILEQARNAMREEFVGLDEQKRMRIDVVLFSILANGANSLPNEGVLTTLENTPGTPWHELVLMHYAHALRAKNAGDLNNVVIQLALANKMITEIDLRGGHDQVIRLRSVLAAQFPQ